MRCRVRACSNASQIDNAIVGYNETYFYDEQFPPTYASRDFQNNITERVINPIEQTGREAGLFGDIY